MVNLGRFRLVLLMPMIEIIGALPTLSLAQKHIYVSALIEGVKFIADSDGIYRFEIVGGAYEVCPPESQPDHPEFWGWNTQVLIYKNRPVEWSGGLYAPEHPDPTNWDFTVGDATHYPSYEQAKEKGRGMFIDISLDKNEYLIFLIYDSKGYFFIDNSGGVQLSITILEPPDELRIYSVASSSLSFDPYWNDLNPDDIDEITICFDINREAYVNIFIYQNNIYDTTVKRFEELPAGTHCYDWDVTNIDHGKYNVMIRAIDPDDAASFAVDESLEIEILRKAFFDPSEGYVVDSDKPLSFKIEEVARDAETLFTKVTVETMLMALNYLLTQQGTEIPFPVAYEFGEWLKHEIDWGDCTVTKVKRDVMGWVPGIGYTKVETWYYKEVRYERGPTYYDEPYRVSSLSYQSFTILPFETTSRIVPIDSAVSEATFNLSWQGSDLDLVLYTPGATRIDATTAWDDPDVGYVEGDTYECYTVRNPIPGDWTMETIAVDVPPEGEEYITVAQVYQDLDYDAKINITEQFIGGVSDIFDLSYKAIMFSPVGDGTSYKACIRNINQLPTDPIGGLAISLSDDDYEYIRLSGQRTVSICGSSFAGFYVGSNGYVTFSEGDSESSESLSNHFDTLRVSCLFNDFDPSSSGTVSIKQLTDRVVVTWKQIPQYGTGSSSTFQVEMYFDGRIQLAWLEVSVLDGIVGLSDGQGLSSSFEETDLSEPSSTSYADLVIGNFEQSMEGWGPTWETPAPTFSYSTTGVTLGQRSLAIKPNKNGFQWSFMYSDLVDLKIYKKLSIDVTWVAAEWGTTPWCNFKDVAVNSDGPSGWKQYIPIDPVNPSWPSIWDPVN